MTFKEFVETLTTAEVDEFWNGIKSVPQEAIDRNWKYSLVRDDKKVPVKWFVKQIATSKNSEVDFNSSYDNRDFFADKFNFDIHEDLVFDQQDWKRFKKFYESVGNKDLFQFFINTANSALTTISANPYRVRMAITHSREAMIIIGMRAVLSYKNDKIGLIVNNENLEEINELYNIEKDYDYKGGEEVCYIYTQPNFILDPSINRLLELNFEAIQNEYRKVEKQKISRWNSEANTTNHTFKKLVFENLNVEEFLSTNPDFRESQPNYWLFQGSPNIYRIKDALQNDAVKSWKVAAHKEKIKKGDKVILWVTGNESGCYALAETLSNVTKIPMENEEGQYYLNAFDENEERVAIKITHNFSENPILKKEILGNPILSNLNAGNQGTNFVATKEQFDEILRISKKQSQTMQKDSPLNQILFGPPGTGKTYNTINKAIQIINPDFNLDQDRETIKKEYDRLIEEGQIVFTTFHQSMSYEDFVEGIKPVIEEDDEGNKSVIYEVKDGILKLIAKEASIKKFRDKEIQTEYNFDDAWNDLLENVRSEFEKNSTLKLNIQTEGMGMNILAISDRGNLVVKPSSSEENRNYRVSYDRTKKLQNAFPNLSKVRNIDKEFRSVIGGSNSTAYWSVVNFINQKIDENSKLSTLKEELPPESFVLIIDEINRGNVSQIFGELITLIEKDKRLGNDEALEAILPYSKEKFGVPNNLYIIGTMNTADRSVEALDTALRRRFSFEEMPPKYDLKELQNTVFDIPLSEILLTINRRIEKLLDKDHCIGHAYFLGKNEDTLQDAFYQNIIPLLQEYFFGDFGKIGLVLGEGFIKKTENNSDFADFDHSDYADFAEKDSFEIVDHRNLETFHSVRKNGVDIPMDFQKAIQLLMKQNIA